MGAAEVASSCLTFGSHALGWLNPLDYVLFRSWESGIFERGLWENLLFGFRIGLALVTAGLLIAELFVRRAGARPPPRFVKWAGITLTVAGFFAYFGFFNPNVRYDQYYHRHEMFHYYLGSKYSNELGYGRLYECTAVAEVELGFGEQLKEKELRALRNHNLIQPIVDTYVFDDPSQCKRHFSSSRWEDFKRDVAWFEQSSRGTYWDNMKKDHGYNPPPVWTMTGKLFASLGPAGDTTMKWLASIDVVLHVATLGLFAWAFGWRVAAVASVFWGTNSVGSFYWTGGAFLRQDWLFLFVASMCLAKRHRYFASGVAITWSALLRVFPGVALFGYGVIIGLHWLRHRRLHAAHRRFIAGCATAAALLVPTSLAVVGPQAYGEFVQHISLHKNTPLTNHMGLESILVHDWDGRMRFTRDDSHDDAFEGWKQGRAERRAQRKPLLVLAWLLLGAGIIWALRKQRALWLGLPLSIPLIISLTNLTCYYYAMFIVFAALIRVRRSLGPPLLMCAAASQILLAKYYWIDDRYAALSYLFFAFACVPLVALSRKPTKQSLKAWLSSLGLLQRSGDRKPALREPGADAG